MATKKPTRKRYGRRADGQTQTSISLSEETLLKARAEAEKRGTTLSKLIEEALKAGLLLLAFLIGIAWLTHTPMDCSGEALGQAVGTGAGWWGTALLYLGSAIWQAGGAVLGMILA